MQKILLFVKQLCYTVYNNFNAFNRICKYNYFTYIYEYLAGGFMNTITINILPENFKPLPIIFNTASAYYKQPTTEYPIGKQDFYQILMVLDGKGTLYCNNDIYKLKKGCAFFTAPNTYSKYTDDGGLATAFLTVTGKGMAEFVEHFDCKNFKFFSSVNIEKHVEDIKEIINIYYKTKNESTLSALSYLFYTTFFEQQQETTLASLDKTALYIEKYFSKKLTLNELAEINKTSISKLCHDFKDKYGYTVFQHIINLRLNYAHNLLTSSATAKTKDVASVCGFDDVSYFCKLYKEKFGTSPRSNNQ